MSTKQKPTVSLGQLHRQSIKAKLPAPAKGFPASMGSQGPVSIMHPHDTTPKDKEKGK